jgi:cation transport protein ChaC
MKLKFVLRFLWLSIYSIVTWQFVFPSFLATRATTSKMQSMQWDEKLGVWTGDKVPGLDPNSLPKPLYVFGYGSLIWKPGPFLERCNSFPGTAIGYKRVFAQRSYDHRGNQFLPGVVMNLVSDEGLLASGYSIPTQDDPSAPKASYDCSGLVWIVPEEDIPAVVEYLDFREKGGYFQQLIDVRLHETTPFHSHNDVVKALVYIGHSHNPNYFLPPLKKEEITTAVVVPIKVSDYFHHFHHKRSIISDLISTAIGPSGRNIDYLLNLYADLLSRNIHDIYLKNLVSAVLLRIGVWRRNYYYHKIFKQFTSPKSPKAAAATNNHDHYDEIIPIYGFGSNEFHQLTRYKDTHDDHPHHPEDHSDKSRVSYKGQCYYNPLELTPHVPHLHNHTAASRELRKREIPWEELEYHHLLAGSHSSAVVNNHGNYIRIWGKLVEILLKNHYFSFPSVSHSLPNDSQIPHSIIIENVKGATLGFDHMLLQVSNEIRIICLGDNSHGQCSGPTEIAIPYGSVKLIRTSKTQHIYQVEYPESEDTPMEGYSRYSVLKMAASLYHSAIITEDGGLITFGEGKFGQTLAQESINNTSSAPSASFPVWYPPKDRYTEQSTKLIDVACGVKHTIVLDDHGTVYSMGSNRYGSLGRRVEPTSVAATGTEEKISPPPSEKQQSNKFVDKKMDLVPLPQEIKFQRVSFFIQNQNSLVPCRMSYVTRFTSVTFICFDFLFHCSVLSHT